MCERSQTRLSRLACCLIVDARKEAGLQEPRVGASRGGSPSIAHGSETDVLHLVRAREIVGHHAYEFRKGCTRVRAKIY
jgi:hypothetical protein